MGVKIATDTTILSRLSKAAREKEIVLTYTHKLFFLRLLKIAAESNGNVDSLCFTYSVKELSLLSDIPIRTATQSLNRLTACGALIRIAGKNTFPRSPTVTSFNKIFYLQETGE